MTIVLNQDAIKTHLIHRYENILLDTISMEENASCAGDLSLTVRSEDELGRDIFLKDIGQASPVLAVPVYMEILALASIVVSGKLKSDEMAIFAGISSFECLQNHSANEELRGSISKISDKGDFLKYRGELIGPNGNVCAGDMTAFFTKKSHQKESVTPTDFSFSSNASVEVIKQNYGKHKDMIICDSLVMVQDTECISSYTYPKNHPLIKGHFPGNPLMMGIMQWMAVEDSLCVYFEQKKMAGINTWSCEAQLYNQDMVLVADIKKMTLKSWIDVPERPNQVELKSTKRLTFRHMVKPGDKIFIHCNKVEKL
ncbi:hypothetical protein DID78_06565 [Candidatus Marinamargulisbacteria bacterium SCGC AG-343-D04]|nr:hypothetical protein DID78_06565 [Candidatus Marinamargulisbacteria bacterium SCGC AG-343-D04]